MVAHIGAHEQHLGAMLGCAASARPSHTPDLTSPAAFRDTLRAKRKRSTKRRHFEARAKRLAALVVAAVEGAIPSATWAAAEVAAELEVVIGLALP